MATVTRLVGDVGVAEDAVQEACLAALRQWPRDGVPASPAGWLIGAAHHKALDWVRREARRPAKEHEAARRDWEGRAPDRHGTEERDLGDDQLALIFTCCHPALDPAVRVPLTLRSVCGLTTAQIAAVFLTPEATMAQRLVRAKRKIRAAAIPFRVPSPDAMPTRLPDVLQVVYLMFTEGHRPSRGRAVTAPELCEESIRLARRLSALMAEEPEVDGLLALLLLTHARRAARADDGGRIVLLGDQDRGAWDREMIREGIELVEAALTRRRPGAYQLQAAIAACHADAADLASTDWVQIAALYGLLWSRQPSPIVAANRAVAVAMSDGPAAGLAVLEELGGNPTVARWAPLHVARAELLAQIGRREDALAAYRTAADLPGPEPERELIAARIAALVDSAR